MCDPFTLMAFAGAGVKAIGSLAEGEASGAIGDLQAQVFAANAETLRKQSKIAALGEGLAYARGAYNESKLRKAGEETLATQRHWYASNNLDPASGSPLLHQALTAGQIEGDAKLVEASAAIEAADARTRAANILSQSAGATANSMVSSMKADAARTAGYFGAATALLTPFSKGASSYSGSGGGGTVDIGQGGNSFPLNFGSA